jgi:cobalt-zinc-cadmium efflux system outer membrane protein
MRRICMDIHIRNVIRHQAVPGLVLIAGLALAAGCSSYQRQPLIADEYQRILAERKPESQVVRKAISSTSYTPEDGLTLAEAEQACLFLNPRLRVARRQAEVPLAAKKYAGLWEDPEVGGDVLRILENIDEPWIAGSSLAFTIPISGRLEVLQEKANAEVRAARIEAWTIEQETIMELRTTWADWSAESQSLEVSGDLLKRLNEVVAITTAREEIGELMPSEAVTFRMAQARLRLDIEQLEATERQSRLRLYALLGFTPQAHVVLISQNAVIPAEPKTSPEDIYISNPSVTLAAARYEVTEKSLRLEIRRQFPDITLGPAYENEEGMHRLGIGFSIPIPILNANRQSIAKADAMREAARAVWEQAVEEAQSQLAQANASLEAARRRHEVLGKTVAPLAELQIETARSLAEIGEINTLLLLQALQSEREAALDLIEAQGDLDRAWAWHRALLPPQPMVPGIHGKGDETK